MRKFYLILFALLLCPFFSFTQSIDTDLLKGLAPRNIGPSGMSGRVTAIDVDLSNPERIVVGTASGGVWISNNGGISWSPIFDKEALQAIGSVAINQKNPSEIWVGTGEGNPRNSLNAGAGIYRSIDGGKNWKLMGLEETRLIHRIIIHRDNPDLIHVAALGSPWGTNPERGVYRSTDGGQSWEAVLQVDDKTGCADLVVDPQNPDKLVAAMWEYGRKPWTFNSGGPGSGIYITHDGGDSWQKRTDKDGLPKGDLGRIGLAIAPSSPNIIYALVEAKKNGLYKSVDGGFNWKMVSDENIGNRPFYYSDIFVDPLNENRIFNLHSTVTRSEDGGKTFQPLLPFYPYSGVHPDHHAFWIHPNYPNFVLEGNDGGLNISRDRGNTWQFVEVLPLAQFYHINYDMEIPYNVMGGMQDNGSWVGPSAVWRVGGIKNHEWQEVYFGDGFDVMMQPNQNRFGYAMSQGGNLGRFDLLTGEVTSIRPVHPAAEELRFNWNAGLAQNPFHECGIYYGSQYLHKSMDCGESWDIISPDLTTNDSTKQLQHKSGGLTIDDTQAENFTTILAIAPSPVDEQVIWVGTDDGNLQLTQDGGQNWENLANKLQDAKPGSWIPQIVASNKKAGEAFIVVNDYRRNDWRPMVYHTNNFGKTFSRIVNEDQVSGHVWSICQDPVEENLLWLGTDYGLYFSIDMGKNWNKWMQGYPSVSTSDLKVHPREHDLVIGTFGRSAWILDDIRPIRAIAASKGGILDSAFQVFEAPDAYLVNYKGVKESRFIANSEFVGENRSRGALLTFWVHPDLLSPKKKKKDKDEQKNGREDKAKMKGQKKGKKSKKVRIQIVDEAGDTIRTFSVKPDTFMNRITWNLRKDGTRYPSRRAPRDPDQLPSGLSVMPGKYTAIFTYGKHTGSTEIKVNADPRVEVSMQALQAKEAAYQDFYKLIDRATKGYDRLKDAQKTIKAVNQSLINVPDSTKTSITDQGKALTDSIKAIMKLYMTPSGLKGIQRSSENINGYLFRTSNYLDDSNWAKGEPSQMATVYWNRAETAIDEALEKINELFDTEWKAYQEAVENIEQPLFKNYEKLE